ncbi:ABC transporter permease [Fodinicola acaciae]|uniref:ABC transporter permease n=1 Tax=Fodinicola acaciae TaxID=2681555 RepID=UPI0013D20160|nr:ABC transporter permease [Fodinicola acaciae]
MVVTARTWTGGSFVSQVWVLTTRSLRTSFADRRLLFFGLLQPIVLLVLFSQVFSGIAALPGIAGYHGYANYLLPATLVNIAAATAMGSGAGLLAEMYRGIVGRFRAMPMSLFSVLLARTLSDSARLALQLTVTALAAVPLLGYRPRAGAVGVSLAVLLSLAVGWGLGWVFIAIASWLRRPEALQAAAFLVGFPLMFTSSAYVPVATMPGWVQVVARGNPLTYAIDGCRGLTSGENVAGSVAVTLGIVALTAGVGGVVAARQFRRGK